MAVYETITPVSESQDGLFGSRYEGLRTEQEKAVRLAINYFKKDHKQNRYLWNAKMRFGKTLSALELARRMGTWQNALQAHRVLIVTHRPVVSKSWKEDFETIFENDSTWHYGTRFEDDENNVGDFYHLQELADRGEHFVFFASMQYLRRSMLVGGDNAESLKADILQNNWDLVVIDEAHEGTRTSLGQRVIDMLTKEKTRVLHLSGTPFNLYDDFSDEQIYTWDYIAEQQAKHDWPSLHPDKPKEANPYRSLPEMEMRIYDLGKILRNSLGSDAHFQFKEFFRTRQGSNVAESERGRFVHEDAVKDFLDLLCADSEDSHYPFSNDEYRQSFNHTLWVLPGVRECKAMAQMLHDHDTFSQFEIINVAGQNDDDETRQDALDKVKKVIGDVPEMTYTITLSCGRLTTGVTVRPWTAVFYLKGSENTSAATYMQTIFRVQSPYEYVDEEGQLRMKTRCYVFDFAPDRSLKMVAETAKFATLTQKEKRYARAVGSREKDIENMQGFLKFCPIIAMDGGKMVECNAERIFEQLDHVYIDRVVRNGFNDNSVYDLRELMALDDSELKDLNILGDEISKSTNMEKPKKAQKITISDNGLGGKESKKNEVLEKARKKKREGKPLTPEEEEQLRLEKEQKERERKERDNRITILRGIALRIPLMMYGADVDNEEEGITLANFTKLVDEASWAEFMPRGVTKPMFRKFSKCFNPTVFVAAGKRYRQLAREADSMSTIERIHRIAEIFSYFHNPDKETVLTPWRVVNMHMSDTIGGYCFWNERFDGPCEKQVNGTDGKLFDWIPTQEPRFVDRGGVTHDVLTDSQSKVLEINSKTGLYPLYVTYSLFRQRCNDFVQNGLIDDPEHYSVEEEQVIWDDILAHNIFVICNTPMARRITMRTLRGFRNVEHYNIKEEKLIERAIEDQDALVADIKRAGYWHGNTSKEEMKFNAVVGNPPYQESSSVNNRQNPIYHYFYDIAESLGDIYSLISPARFLFNAGLTPPAWNQKMLNDKHLKVVYFTQDSSTCFPNTDIKGGVVIMMRNTNILGKAITTFLPNKSLNSIASKFDPDSDNNLKAIIFGGRSDLKFNSTFLEEYPQSPEDRLAFIQIKRPQVKKLGSNEEFELKSSTFEALPYAFLDMVDDARNYYHLLGLVRSKRAWKYVEKRYMSARYPNNNNIEAYKVFVPKANGSGILGEALSKTEIGKPGDSATSTFISIGAFESEEEAVNCSQYLKTKLLRCLLGILKITQDNPPSVWAYIPLQDFTSSSDIDWTQSVADIDRQLYKKYNLSEEEIDFIERMIKPME